MRSRSCCLQSNLFDVLSVWTCNVVMEVVERYIQMLNYTNTTLQLSLELEEDAK